MSHCFLLKNKAPLCFTKHRGRTLKNDKVLKRWRNLIKRVGWGDLFFTVANEFLGSCRVLFLARNYSKIFISRSLCLSCSISLFRISDSGNCSLYFEVNILLFIPPGAYLTTVFFLSKQRMIPAGSFSSGSFSLSFK